MPLNEQQKAEAVSAVLAGDTARFSLLVREHQQKVFALCLSLLQNPSEAEEAAQAAFVRAFEKLSSFRLQSSFSTWLYRIVYNLCMDRLKERQRSLPVEDTMPAPEPSSREEDVRLLKQALAKLPREYQAVLMLREGQGLSYEEIAETTGVTVESVRARLARARKALQQEARHFFGT